MKKNYFQVNLIKNLILKFQFKSDPIFSSDIEFNKYLKISGKKYFVGQAILDTNSLKYINDNNIKLYFRTRYKKDSEKQIIGKNQEPIYQLMNNICFLELQTEVNYYFIDIANLLENSKIDYVYMDKDTDQNIIHFSKDDRNDIPIEGYLVYTDDSLTSKFRKLINKVIKK